MPETQCLRIPLKPGHSEGLVHWIGRLKDRAVEVGEALKLIFPAP
jgi:hypothetical protein